VGENTASADLDPKNSHWYQFETGDFVDHTNVCWSRQWTK